LVCIHSVNPISEKEKWPFKSATAYSGADFFEESFDNPLSMGKADTRWRQSAFPGAWLMAPALSAPRQEPVGGLI